MAQRRATLWCKLMSHLAEVILEPAHPGSSPVPGAPAGWQPAVCLDRINACYGTGCPFTTDGGDCPFGEPGESLDGPPERFDPMADPSFEGEWD